MRNTVDHHRKNQRLHNITQTCRFRNLCKTAFSPYLPHSYVVETIRAVEDHTLYSDSFGQILGGLSLPCSCRPLRGSIQVQMKSSNQSSGEQKSTF